MFIHADNEILRGDFIQDSLPFPEDLVRIILACTILDNDFPEFEPLLESFTVMFGRGTPMGLFEFAHPDEFHMKHRVC